MRVELISFQKKAGVRFREAVSSGLRMIPTTAYAMMWTAYDFAVMALRFMESKDNLGTHIRVFSNASGAYQPHFSYVTFEKSFEGMIP